MDSWVGKRLKMKKREAAEEDEMMDINPF